MKGQIKSITVDRYLQPIRKQIYDLIEPQTNVIEFGCGNGRLMMELSQKINTGIGVDSSLSLVKYALRLKEKHGLDKIDFKQEEINPNFKSSNLYDYSIASLFFHVFPFHNAVEILKVMSTLSKKVLICGFVSPQSLSQELMLGIDQFFSGHFKNFRSYKRNGYIEGLLKNEDFTKIEYFDTFDPVIKIVKLQV